ncbi:hypothetical protein [Jannaschia sp. M317]|uniref:hypothetical protein n=1 Tax=Jannaschia sp. M317 TaxID=2867011 RepID=UPI0021A7F6FF|nr:hypothetical protein [Jannaschia sp. M317]UWQ18414.1 hypothetical protein K3551_03665 [Jannaschia sp. M317]
MCLTASALAMFLTLIGPEVISAEPGRYTIRSDTRDVHWIASGETWCTDGPQQDRRLRFASVAAK